ncbi:MAG: outer membrane beta-barrel protein [Geobacter sp.]|nr:outer membrane beta-barrel protein [Geobacter sp.]
MRKFLTVSCLCVLVALAASQAQAQSIKGKLGVTGRIGFTIPADSDFGPYKIETDAGFIGGGGFIYGIDNNFAAEIDITNTSFGSEDPTGGNKGDFDVTNVALGGQYRFESSQANLTPYVGAGLDILLSDYDRVGYSVDTTVGAHATGGVDYFINRQVALNAEAKILVAPETDINGPGGKAGNFDPSSFTGTFGVRFFFN